MHFENFRNSKGDWRLGSFFFFFLGLKSILYIALFSDFVGIFFCYVENKPSGGLDFHLDVKGWGTRHRLDNAAYLQQTISAKLILLQQ
jgi:hypothetical protein